MFNTLHRISNGQAVWAVLFLGLLLAIPAQVWAAPGPNHQDLADDHQDLEDDINANTDAEIADHDANLAAHDAAGPTKIDGCQTINATGSYALIGDITADLNSDCIVITVDDVTLDLMGFNIFGNGDGNGITIFGSPLTNVEVRNGTIRNFQGTDDATIGNGIFAPEFLNKGFRIINVRAVSNDGIGIHLEGIGHLVKDCTVIENGTEPAVFGNDGIHVGSGSTVTGNTAFGNARHGIEAGSGSTVTGNTASSNQRGLVTGDGSTVAHNTATDNSVGIDAGSNSALTGNTVWENTTGIDANFRNLIKGNTVTANAEGITVGGDFNVIEENLLVGNSDGLNSGGIVLLSGAEDNFCDNNRFADNKNDVVKIAPANNVGCTANTGF